MAPHVSGQELDTVRLCVAKHMPAAEILSAIAQERKKVHVEPPKIWAVRRAMAGSTHLQGKGETRGRAMRLTDA